MKKVTVTLTYDEEKLSALKLYLEQKGQTVESELTAACDSLYVKTVPTNVRDYIDLRAGVLKAVDKKKPTKPKTPAPAIPVQDRGEDN